MEYASESARKVFFKSSNCQVLFKLQKQPSRVVLRKRYSENVQQIYRRTPLVDGCFWNKFFGLSRIVPDFIEKINEETQTTLPRRMISDS